MSSLVTSDYSENDTGTGPGALHFAAQDGNQFFDATGRGNQGVNGIEQVISTVTTGTSYVLSFFVGNADGNQNYSLPSSLELAIDGTVIATDTNDSVTNNAVNWKQFTHTFEASGNSTTIRFLNRTPMGDNAAGLDNVTLRTAP